MQLTNERSKTDEDIDLLGLLKSLLNTWKIWLLSLMFVSVIFGTVKALQILTIAPDASYSKPIRLTFPNAHKLLFPSGASFAYSDIVAPAVVQIAFEKNKLSDYGLTIADLQGGLSSAPYAPTYQLIVKRYESLLNDKKLSADQIAELQKNMTKELEQATAGEALITLRLGNKDLPNDVASNVLNDIPAIWAERTIKDKGVLEINVQLASANALNIELIKQKEALIAGDILNDKLKLLKENIEELTMFEGSQSVKDPVTGLTLLDLSYAIDDLNNYVIGGLLAPIRFSGLSNEPESSSFYYADKINKLKIKLSALQKQAAAIKTINDSYSKFEQSTPSKNVDGQNSPNIIPQLNADMLDKLVSLSGEVEREQYKQGLNKEWLKIIKEITTTESTINDAQTTLLALENTSKADAKTFAKNKEYLDKVESEMPAILEKASSYFGITDRIYKQLSVESVGIRDQLYIPITNGILVKKTLIDIKSTAITWIALLFLTTIIVIPFTMLRNVLKAKNVMHNPPSIS